MARVLVGALALVGLAGAAEVAGSRVYALGETNGLNSGVHTWAVIDLAKFAATEGEAFDCFK